jgi:hypothetical protein
MPNIDSEFPSQWLKAADFDEDGTVVTVESYRREEIKNREGKMEQKPVLYFRGYDKGLILNKTNATKLTKLFQSANTDDWSEARDRWQRDRIIAGVALGAGTALVVTGVLRLSLRDRNVAVTPAQSGGALVSIGGAW